MTSPAWDGRPSNPEVNGYHWLRKGPHSDARPFIADWHGPLFVQGEWSSGGVWYTPKAVALLWSYLGPVAPYQDATADAGGPEGATKRNKRVQDRIDEMTHIGRHGYYETVFQVVREEVERVHPPTPHPDVAQAVADERERPWDDVDPDDRAQQMAERLRRDYGHDIRGTAAQRWLADCIREIEHDAESAYRAAHPPTPRPGASVEGQSLKLTRLEAEMLYLGANAGTADDSIHHLGWADSEKAAFRRAEEKLQAYRAALAQTESHSVGVEGLRALSEAATPGNLHISGHNTTAAIAVHDGPDAKGHRHLDGRHQHNVLEARETTFEQQRADIEFARAAWNHVRAALAQSDPARTPETVPHRDGGPSR